MGKIEIVSGCIKAILEKYADPIVNGLKKISRDEWEKIKIDLDVTFTKYLKNATEKYGKIKTILYRAEPKYIYDFFECPNLKKSRTEIIRGDCVNNVLDVSKFLIIQGMGGVGKSTFLKHLFIDEIKNKDLIPVFIELKDLNLTNDEYELSDFVFQRLYDLGSTIKKEYLQYALQSGCFLFLLDGYDEIVSAKKDIFFKKLDSFCDRYSDNYFVISSRPYSEFVEFQRFSVLTLCELNKAQAMSLIGKIEFDSEIKHRFQIALDEYLYSKHQSFASNPLLLNIMLLTFDNYAEIPEKVHLFYDNAFETLYSKHDATKSGYKRELKSNLTYDSFKKIFSRFCFITYFHGKMELSYDDLIATLKKVSVDSVNFNQEDYVFDLINSVCVIYKDGLNYRFTHRSFQEYFTAVFLRDLSDSNMQKMGISLIKKDVKRADFDNVFRMLRDMANQRFEQNILLELLCEVEATYNNEDKYDFYFEKCAPAFEFRKIELTDEEPRLLLYAFDDLLLRFLFNIINFHNVQKNEEKAVPIIENVELYNFLLRNRKYVIGAQIRASSYRDDADVYNLIKKTWIGTGIFRLSRAKEEIQNKCKNTELDLSSMLLE
ncbi:MAG: NACHT domain-containing protein [Subdoligranulum sp.]|nr:NACHT domain-containing protein [Subdoligranulum sp.]